MPSAYQEVARRKQAQRDGRIKPEWRLACPPAADVLDVTGIPRTCGILTDEEIRITETDAVDLVAQLAKGQLTAVAVTLAFCKRAAIAQQLVNALTEFFPDEALETAKSCDDYLAKLGKPRGPLHGLPVSVKDNFKVKGHASSVGFTAWAEEEMQEDSELIKILRNAGAVLHCKTNISEAMMIAESYNNVWGRTVNPVNRSLTCGGSSGGEGALLALYGSPLGVGTDIGGSVRIPSACNGLFGLKPSLGRFPTYNARSGMAGQEAVASTNGPMSRSLSALDLYARTVVGAEPWLTDPKMLPIPWRDVTLPEKLVIGIVYDDGYVRPCPPILRALRETVDKLRTAGHEVVEWDVGAEYAEAAERIARLFLADGGVTIKTSIGLSDEPWPKGLEGYRATSLDPANDLRTSEMWKLQADRTAYAARIYAKWNATASRTRAGRPIDALLTPAMALPPCRHDQFRHVGYTCIWNMADMPGVVFPVTKVDKAQDHVEQGYQPRNEDDKHVYAEYDPEVYHGAPITLQLVTRKLEEEKALAITKLIYSL